MKEPKSRRSPDPRLSAWIVVVMSAMVAVPAAIFFPTARRFINWRAFSVVGLSAKADVRIAHWSLVRPADRGCRRVDCRYLRRRNCF